MRSRAVSSGRGGAESTAKLHARSSPGQACLMESLYQDPLKIKEFTPHNHGHQTY